jgi:hypothetical protein
VIKQAIAEMEELAQRISGLRQTQQHGQALARRQQSISLMLDRAERARTAVRILAPRLGSDAPSDLPASAADARSQIDSWALALDDDLSAALGGEAFAQLNDVVLRAVADLESQASQLWQRYVAHHAPHTSNEILEALTNDSRARVAVIRIRRLADLLSSLRDRTVPSSEDIDSFDQAARELHEAWATLDVETIDPQVVAFLRAANSDSGAPISTLTSDVLRWLEERGATDQYVIKPAD